MTPAEKIAEIAADGVADGMHVVGEEALAAEKVVRGLDNARLGFLALGIAIGGAVGALTAFKVAYSKAETKFSKIADEEIEEMRQHYQDKVLSLESTANKADLEEIVQEKGYVSTDDEKPPMAVTPPEAVVEAVSESGVSEETTRVPPPVPAAPAPEAEVRNIFRHAEEGAAVMDSWDYEAEKRLRSPDIPYVIHYDERNEFEGYGEMTLTLYEKDDVLCNERDEVIGEGRERDELVGERNLDRFGHGSNDPQIVYVRNDKLEMVFEIVKSPNSFAEEVHGFEHDSYSNVEKMRLRERDALDDGG